VFKGFLYHCRIIRAFGWVIPLVVLVIGALGFVIGSGNGVAGKVSIMLVTIFSPFLIYALTLISDDSDAKMMVKSLPMLRSDLLKGRCLFVYFVISVSAFLTLGIVQVSLFYNQLVLGDRFIQNLGGIFIVFWSGMILIHSVMLPFFLSSSIYILMLYFCLQLFLLIFVASDIVYSFVDPFYLLMIIIVSVVSIPLSYKFTVKNDPENREE